MESPAQGVSASSRATLLGSQDAQRPRQAAKGRASAGEGRIAADLDGQDLGGGGPGLRPFRGGLRGQIREAGGESVCDCALADGQNAQVPEPEDSLRDGAAAGVIGPAEMEPAERPEAASAGDRRGTIQGRNSRSSRRRLHPASPAIEQNYRFDPAGSPFLGAASERSSLPTAYRNAEDSLVGGAGDGVRH